MEFGDDVILRCPDCHFLFAQRTLLSASNQGLIRWTDGYWTSHYLNIVPIIIYCPFCKTWLPIEDAETLFTLPISRDYGFIPIIETDDECSEENYLSALESPRCIGMEKTLRIRLWWRQNAKRRNGSQEALILSKGLHDNLERLITLFDPGEAIWKAEALRELGDFEEALEVLSQADETGRRFFETEPGKTMRINCEKNSILPVTVGARTVPEVTDIPERKTPEIQHIDFDLPGTIRRGLYPFPYSEDVFAFPTMEKESEDVLLSVDLSCVQDDWTGWATFFKGESEYRLKYDRLFSEEEWAAFQDFPAVWKKALIEFWKYRTYELENHPQIKDHYYCVLYQLFHGVTGFVEKEVIEEQKSWVDPIWKDVMRELQETGGDAADWMNRNEIRWYWDYFWMIFSGEYPAFCAEDMVAGYRKSLEYEQRYAESRSNAADGLQYLELGGFPRWFQGVDMTPKNPGGGSMEFVGQIWTDYLNVFGSMLVYVFYDPKEGCLKQVYDYD